MKHRTKKMLNIHRILSDAILPASAALFLNEYGYLEIDPVNNAETLYDMGIYSSWLVDHGYVEAIPEEKTYKLHDCFSLDGDIYMIVRLSLRYCKLVKIYGDDCFLGSEDHRVEDVYKITEDELKSMGGIRYKHLIPVKVKITVEE